MTDEGTSIRSVRRALQILALYKAERMEWGITEIGRALGIAKSVVYRLVSTFEQEGYLVQNPENGKYRLGIRLFELGSLVIGALDLRKVVAPFIEELSRQSGETVHVGVLDGTDIISIEQTTSAQTLRLAVYVGKRAPLYCTAIGKALLAFLPEEDRARIAGQTKFIRYTSNTVTDPEMLDKELAAVRVRGYAVDEEEHDIGVRCVGAPIWGYHGEVVASISISGPAVRITRDRVPALAELAIAAARDISRELGANTAIRIGTA